MLISIIVPAFNEERLLPESLSNIFVACQAFHDRHWQTEVVVVDNNSQDRTAAVARDLGAKVVFEGVNQISRARNRGAAEARGDWLVFIDADSFPSRKLFSVLANVLQGGKVVGGGVRMRFDSGPGWSHLVGNSWNCLSAFLTWAAGAFIFVRRDVFEAIGGFDQRVFISEELFFSESLKKKARELGKSMVILRGCRLLTSGRKFTGPSLLKLKKLLAGFASKGLGVFGDREACQFWYENR